MRQSVNLDSARGHRLIVMYEIMLMFLLETDQVITERKNNRHKTERKNVTEKKV